MKIRIVNDGPNNKSVQTVSVSGLRETPSSHQFLDRNGELTLNIEGEVNLEFDISGDIQPVTYHRISVLRRGGCSWRLERRDQILKKKAKFGAMLRFRAG